ncbi:Isoleucyl-tRNA synthetase [Akanthomyces lecanii RCEF 1005]|uniref:isoleucine--tRNA ligase n=1 Tax=Akanthomyces lecanii RCEF 1005 TaxID=1081108 RepID=A0A168HA08_CORDF|nr:Isoleucyl-tRNA synthetase [Akanthomyces lecanii RCEF 1005]
MRRLGRWIDMDNDYKAMDVNFMETEWWVFKRLFDKGLVYRSYQVMPYSTALCTPLSHMESKQAERMTQDPAIVVSFPVLGQAEHSNTSLLVYTTTPWTLPSNLLIAVHKDFEYLKILDERTQNYYITLENGLKLLYKDPAKAKYKVVSNMKGHELVNWRYEPLFSYFTQQFSDCFQVIAADFVEAGEGTGLVPQSPAFGEEDYAVATAAGFISPNRLPPCPVDEKGRFTAEVVEYAGQHVKEADKAILRDLRKTGRLLHESQIMHSDKFCWRSDTQLIRRAVSSWFVKVTDAIPTMQENLQATKWVPSFVKDKRFANWVSGAHDWNVSRNRYWGTPIPIWASDDYEELVCVGSIEELRQLSGYDGPLYDLHRDKIDHITIPSKHGKGQLHRVSEILDCWFDSGCMPYASVHYPFENKDALENGHFPADFIAEGLDQTRGWFYTLTVLGNLLFEKSPFRNVLVNGMVLAEDGKKMSKSLKNYPAPTKVFDEYGSDALRLYLISSPVVRAEPLRFKETAVKEIISHVLLPLWNSFRFFSEQAALYKTNHGEDLVMSSDFATADLTNVMDRWILANCQSLLQFVEQEMAAYRLFTVVPRLLTTIDDLTNWYIRFNRKRLKGAANLGQTDTLTALRCLLQVLFTLVKALAPFTPFITDHIYGLLKPYLGPVLDQFQDARSVHFLPFPTVQHDLFDENVQEKVRLLQQVVQLGRVARERNGLSLRTPLSSAVVIADERQLSDLESVISYVREELNLRTVLLSSNEAKYDVVLEARVDWPTLGKKLKKQVQSVRKALSGLSQDQLRSFQETKSIEVAGVVLGEGDIALVRSVRQSNDTGELGKAKWEAAFGDGVMVLLDIESTPELEEEGLIRDLISRVQKLRKQAKLVSTEDVRMEYAVLSNSNALALDKAIADHKHLIAGALRGELFQVTQESLHAAETCILQEDQEMSGVTLRLALLRN